MSAPFAKLFDTQHGQLLVFMDNDDEGSPALKVMGAAVRGIYPSTSFGGWKDAAAERQQHAFDITGQEEAEKLAAALAKMAGNLAA